MPPCLTLSIIRYGSRVKWSNPRKGVAPSPTPWCSSYRKGSLRVTLDYDRQLYLLIIIYISHQCFINKQKFFICNKYSFLYWPACLMFSTLLTTMNFHLFLALSLTLLLNVDNFIFIYPCKELLISCFKSLEYHLSTGWVHLSSVYLVMRSSSWVEFTLLVLHDHILHSVLLLNFLASDVLMQWYGFLPRSVPWQVSVLHLLSLAH